LAINPRASRSRPYEGQDGPRIRLFGVPKRGGASAGLNASRRGGASSFRRIQEFFSRQIRILGAQGLFLNGPPLDGPERQRRAPRKAPGRGRVPKYGPGSGDAKPAGELRPKTSRFHIVRKNKPPMINGEGTIRRSGRRRFGAWRPRVKHHSFVPREKPGGGTNPLNFPRRFLCTHVVSPPGQPT